MKVEVYKDRKFCCFDDKTDIVIEISYNIIDESFSHWFGTEELYSAKISGTIIYDSEGYILDEDFTGNIKNLDNEEIFIENGYIKELIKKSKEMFTNYEGDL